MKESIALLFVASTLFVAGCCSTYQSGQKWEYKVVAVPVGLPGTRPVDPADREQFLNGLAKDGWILVTTDADVFYLKRAKY